MVFGFAADAVVIIHLGFVGFVAFGAAGVWWRPRLALLHLPAVAWGVGIELTGTACPLTPLEQWLRLQTGPSSYERDFVAHYVLPVLYPPGLTSDTQWLLGGVVCIVNLMAYACIWRARTNRSKTHM